MFEQNAALAEVRGVVGHDMGHYALYHSVRLVIGFTLIALVLLGLAQLLFAPVAHLLGESGRITGLTDPAGLAVLMTLLATLQLIATPLINSLSRGVESEADTYSIEHFREPVGLWKALVKTDAYRAATLGRLEEIVFTIIPPSVSAYAARWTGRRRIPKRSASRRRRNEWTGAAHASGRRSH